MDISEIALTPARLRMAASDRLYQPDDRLWQGIPSLAWSGRTGYAVFYSGQKTEESGNFAVVIRSQDDGRTWTDPWMVIEHTNPEVRVFDPNLWLDPLGRLWLFWAQSRGKYDGRAGVWASVSENPDADRPAWSEPRRIANGIMMNKPTVLADGTWLLPCAVWISHPAGEDHPEMAGERHSNVVASTDQGRTFQLRGGAEIPDRSFDEHQVAALQDGRLWMLVRTRYGIGQSFSADNGFTWTPGEDSGLGGPCSRFFIGRLQSGRLLLVNHVGFSGRSHLTALLSEDDGQTWPYRLLLDERRDVSYPDAAEMPAGRIRIIYDRERYKDREILFATLDEADILAGACRSETSRLRQVISRASGQREG
jgi:hypothetical protein